MSHTTIKYKLGVFICLSIIGLVWLPAVIAAPGDLDTSFSQDGKLVETIGAPINVSDWITEVIMQPDGKILALGSGYANGNFSIVARYAANGSLDPSFGSGGRVLPPFQTLTDIALQPDGKIVAVGASNESPDMLVVRLNSNGSIDSSFGDDGQARTDFGGSDIALQVAIQPDGKIVAAGETRPSAAAADVAVARYDQDGTLDSSFDDDGKVTTDIAGSSETVSSLILGPDGKINVIGSAMTGTVNRDYMLVRYLDDGSLDTTFDGDGKVTTDFFGSYDNLFSAALQADGKIIVTGAAFWPGHPSNDIVLARYNTDGSLDTTFDGDGKLMADIPSANLAPVRSIAVQSDGKIVVAGYVNFGGPAGSNDFLVVRFGPDGLLDTTFDNDGYAITDVSGSIDEIASVVIQNDGKILAAGSAHAPALNQDDFGIARYNSDGSLDTAFGNNGKVVMNVGFTIAPADAFDVAVQPDGKIVFAGQSGPATNRNFAILRYLPNGLPDASFDGDGQVLTDFMNGDDQAFAVAVQADGRIVAAGYAGNGTNEFVAIARYNSDGSPDASFGSGGKLTTSVLGIYDYAYDLVIQPDGKLVVAGFGYNGSDSDFILVRYNSNGSLDTSFGNGGKAAFSVLGSHDEAYAMALEPDGKIVATGSAYDGSSWVFAAARVNANGSLDATFSDDGRSTIALPSTRQGASAVAIQGDNKIVAAGTGDDNFTRTVALVRYNADGSLDTTFDGDGRVITTGAVADAVAVQPGGKIVVGGSSNSDFAVLRYNPDGSPDTSYGSGGKVAFDIAGGVSDSIYCLAIDESGRAVAGGNSGGYFAAARVLGDPAASRRTPFDFDGDGKSDISVFRPSTGDWYLNRSTAGFLGVAFGSSTDKIVPADYDGDGKTDIAVYRPSTGIWYVTRSGDASVSYHVFGTDEDLPTPADYDGDGKADISVFRPSTGTWYRTNSSDESFTAVQFGQTGDRPTIGDSDGDGKADIAVFRPLTGAWYQVNSSDGSFSGEQFGNASDHIAPADYDGDGKTDIGIYRPSEGLWYHKNSGDGTYTPYVFGLSDDIPVVGDYDGDGRSDIGVFRPSDGYWYIVNSSNGSFTVLPWGQNGDIPTQSAFGN